jgi:hypothetical protein
MFNLTLFDNRNQTPFSTTKLTLSNKTQGELTSYVQVGLYLTPHLITHCQTKSKMLTNKSVSIMLSQNKCQTYLNLKSNISYPEVLNCKYILSTNTLLQITNIITKSVEHISVEHTFLFLHCAIFSHFSTRFLSRKSIESDL